MIQAVISRKGRGVRSDVAPSEFASLAADPGCIMWIDASAPSDEELGVLAETLTLDPLAMEVLTQDTPHSRIVQYPGHYAIAFHALRSAQDGTGMALQRIGMVMGRGLLLTLHRENVEELALLFSRWQQGPNDTKASVAMLVYTLLDALIDTYFPVIDQMAERVDAMEDELLRQPDGDVLSVLFELKRDMLSVRRAVAPERDVINVLLRREQDIFEERSLVYFQDLYDHIVRVTDSVDTYRDLLTNAMDTYLTATSNRLAKSANRLNQTMQTLTSWSIILMSASLVAGVYGMNFRYMPELQLRYGYYGALGLMAALGLLLARYFRRRGWM